MSVWS